MGALREHVFEVFYSSNYNDRRLYMRKQCSLHKILRITVSMIVIENVFSVGLHCAVHANLGIDYYMRL